jgi:hypothetical protein
MIPLLTCDSGPEIHDDPKTSMKKRAMSMKSRQLMELMDEMEARGLVTLETAPPTARTQTRMDLEAA